MPFPLSSDEMEKTEKELGAKFPESYRVSMMLDNGGSVEVWEDDWELFPIRNQESRKLISRTANHIIKETNSAKEWRGYPDNAVAIGSNGCGDLLVFVKENSMFSSKVYVWGHEDASLTSVANDFSELKKA